MERSAYRPQRNYGCRIHDQYTYQGMRTVVMENELVRISILADKGTDIFEFLYKPRDLDLIWLSAEGVSNPNAYLPTSPDPTSTFIDYYPGGWQEVFPNGGPPSSHLGAEFGQHGEVAHMPWDYDILEDSPEKISVRFQVKAKKIPCRILKTLTLHKGSPVLLVEETVENESDADLRYMWGHHLTFGRPFLQPGCRIRLPEGVRLLTEPPGSALGGRVKRTEGSYAWPLAPDESGEELDVSILPSPGTDSDMLYVTGFGDEAWYEVRNEISGIGVRVGWDVQVLPFLWYWQEYGATKSYPWYGRHYNIGLEPFAGYPTHGIAKAVENGSAGTLGPRESRRLRLTVAPFPLAESQR